MQPSTLDSCGLCRMTRWRPMSLPGWFLLLGMGVACGIPGSVLGAERAAEFAERISQTTGVSRGFIVHVGCGVGELTGALAFNSGCQVHGLDRDPANVAAARESLRASDRYGPVSIDQLRSDGLPYIDDFVNLVVASDLQGITVEEIRRVLCPAGVAYIREGETWTLIRKPRPQDIDDWTHYFHDASGNPVAHDQVVAPPERLQWVGSPRWSRHHDRMASMSALVSANGHLYYIMDEGSRISIQLPSRWQLIARDAFNGTILWKRPIAQWHDQMWPLKSGPTQLARRLVADSTDVFVTLGIKEPVARLNGTTGETVQTYAGTEATEEILHHDGLLVLLVNPAGSELDEFAPKLNTGDQGRVANEFVWNEVPRHVKGIDAKSGRTLWTHTGKVAPLTLCANGEHVVFHDGERIVSLDRQTGAERWGTDPAPRRRLIPFHFGPRLVLYQDQVLYAGGEGRMRSYSAADGKLMWESEHAPSGYQSPQDLIVTGGLVWVAPTTSGRDTGIFKGRDLLSGEVKVEFPPDIETYWFHHRCYIAKATDRFLIPSRTGIELVDYKAKHWDINHWVRGGCLYGVMPCNGLLYAPPHNCACYPEAKLYGLNALAPAAKGVVLPKVIPEEGRLETGPAYAEPLAEVDAAANEWPTYRHDSQRSGSTKQELSANLDRSWETKLSGRLSAAVIAQGQLFVAQCDAHTLHSLDAKTGKPLWSFTAGGRIDSPPTFWKGRLLFGSADGWVYSLRAGDGALLWKYRAAPVDRRLMAFEQLESVWPVHGTILVEHDAAHFIVGRSSFLDGGMWYIRLDPRTGRKLSETAMNDRDPETGKDLQERLQTLQMPVGLADILSSDGENVFLRSQKFDREGNRLEIGPVSGQAPEQGGTQSGPGRHLFAPMGFLDDTWFHRSYWVYGKNFAGGHNGYYQAGKHTPSGRILVFNDKEIFGYARQPQYYRWTTPLEHQLFAASRDAASPTILQQGQPSKPKNAKGADFDVVSFANSRSLDPSKSPLTVEAWVKADAPNGVIVSHGGPANGYALYLAGRKPGFAVRTQNALGKIEGDDRLPNGWNHLAGVLGADKTLTLYLNGTKVAAGPAPGFIAAEPKQTMEFGGDSGGSVGDYGDNVAFTGSLDEVRIHKRALSPAEISAAARQTELGQRTVGDAVLVCTFDDGNAKDATANRNDGELGQLPTGQGRVGIAVVFPKLAPAARANAVGNAAPPQQMGFDHEWTKFVQVFARAMLLANDSLCVVGPPDLVDEEYALERLAAKDPAIHEQLKAADDALEGKQGGRFLVVSTKDGSRIAEFHVDALPVWDGMSAAYGRVYLSTTDGRVICFGQD